MAREVWYVKSGAREFGPFSTNELRAQAANGKFGPSSLVRLSEETEFYEAGEYRQLAWLKRLPKHAASAAEPTVSLSRSLGIGLAVGTALTLLAVVVVGMVLLLRTDAPQAPQPRVAVKSRPERKPVEVDDSVAPAARPATMMPLAPPPAPRDAGPKVPNPLLQPPKVATVPPAPAQVPPAPPAAPADQPGLAEAPLPPKPELHPKPIAPVVPETKRPATKESFAELQKSLKKVRQATDGLQLYEAFARTWTFTAEQQALVDREQQVWKDRAAAKLVLLGKKWVSPAEAEAASKDAEHIVKQALALMEIGSLKEAVERLEEASKADPNSIRADFTLALLYSAGFTGMHDAELTEKHYRQVLNRYPDHLSALNNIAIAQIKQKKYDVAFESLTRLAEIAPRCREMSQNVGRLILLAEGKRIAVPEGQLKRYSRTYAELIASGKGQAADPRTGWLHMPLYLPDAERKVEEPDNQAPPELVAWGQGTGFVVAPDLVLTNRHVVYDDDYDLGVVDAVKILDPHDPKGQRQLVGSVVAVSDDTDLALVRFPDLKLPALMFAARKPQLTEEVLILGYPQSQSLGSNLKSLTGRVSGVPDVAQMPILFDAVTNQGNSGGPVFDRSGRVLAVYTWVLTVGTAVRTQYGGGIGTEAVGMFLKTHVPDAVFKDGMDPDDDWPTVTERVGPSVLKLDTFYAGGSRHLVALFARTGQGRSYLEDLTCPDCDGRGKDHCPQRGCARGMVSLKSFEMRVQNTPQGRVTARVPVSRKVVCNTCSGTGFVQCAGCANGSDRALLRGR